GSSEKSGTGKASEESGTPSAESIKAKLAEKAMPKNRSVSITDPANEAKSGAFHQWAARRREKIVVSSNCAKRNAAPEAIAIRGVERMKLITTAMAKPTSTTLRAAAGPNWRLVRSLTRNATG